MYTLYSEHYHRLRGRILATEELRAKLGQELSYLDTETKALSVTRDQLSHAMLALSRPEEVCIHNLKARGFRQGTEY